ncbi:MAG: cation:proton antiporter [Anaerolineae bacterium]|nr:cation:proton antiporter [Anaerolineae bacterium]
MDVFTAASHHEILLLLFQITILLFTARFLAEIAQRLGQPAVIGEIMAGILLGPSFLSSLVPLISDWIVPHTPVQGYLLELVSLIGVMFLLLITGLEMDIPLIRRHARTALSAAAGGLVLPLITGFLLGLVLPDTLLNDPDRRLIFALFVAAAMSISAIPVIAKVLFDLKLMRRDIGQTIIAAGMVDDTTAWILLSVIIGMASGEVITLSSVALSILTVVLFMVLSFTAGRWLVKRALDLVQDEIALNHRLLSLVVVLTFAWGAISQAIGLEAIFGAFVMGILFGQMPRLPQSVIHTLEAITLGIFAPIFFAVAGLKVNLTALLQPRLFLIALAVIAVATFGKVVGTYIGARWLGRRDHYTALAFGAGLNARGAMEIIIATIGLNLGILSQDMFTIIVVMAMATSLMAPSALRWVLKRIQPEDQELQRLRQEELAQGSLVAGIHRVLLPIRRREQYLASQTVEAHVLKRLGQQTSLSLTLFNVAGESERPAALEFLRQVSSYFTVDELLRKVVPGNNPGDLILDEVRKDYDLLVMGASEKEGGSGMLFTPLVDTVVRLSPCPTLIVKGGAVTADWKPSRMLVATNGSAAAKNAAELAFTLATKKEEVIILHVVDETGRVLPPGSSDDPLARRLSIGHQIVDQLRESGELRGVTVITDVEIGLRPEQVILTQARQRGVDLIILGTDVRLGSDRLFLGPRVEYILTNAICPVLVINTA